MKLVTIIGARPQFIKAAVLSRAIKKWNHKHFNKEINEIIIHTGQHYDKNMSEIFFEEMHIPKPKYNLHTSGGNHGEMTGQMMIKIEEVLLKENPDVVLVYGDTNSTLAGALVASKMHIPIAHVEAGLRSFNMNMPEEINRILTDRVSKILFCPTENACLNLKQEGYNSFNIVIENVGDVMYDAALFYKKIANPTLNIVNLVNKNESFYLATIHRAENTDNINKLRNIVKSLNEIGEKTKIVLPIHPRTKKIIEDNNISTINIELLNPVGYFDMLFLLENCQGVFTDSGGLQKEAYFFNKACVTMREQTEWTELVDNNFNILVGADCNKILGAIKFFKDFKADFSLKLYGDGNAGEKIIKSLVEGLF